MKNLPSQAIADEMIEKSPYAGELIFLEDGLLLDDDTFRKLLAKDRIVHRGIERKASFPS